MTRFISAIAALLLTPAIAFAAAEVGKPAAEFSVRDIEGKTQSIAQYKGKIVVLEWNNPGCPFVVKHYSSKNMQTLQNIATQSGVVWLSINSSAPGKEGHLDAAGAKAYVEEQGALPAAYILDADGKIGHSYGASATPHMFVIDANGTIAYQGAIDDTATADSADIAKAKNYVTAAITALQAGKTPEVSTTQAYGCGVKYAN